MEVSEKVEVLAKFLHAFCAFMHAPCACFCEVKSAFRFHTESVGNRIFIGFGVTLFVLFCFVRVCIFAPLSPSFV